MYKEKFMKCANLEAMKNLATKEGGPFGSVIVKNGEIIAKGHNLVLSSHDPTAHGEIVTIRKACNKLHTFDLTGCELYTNAYPCPMCLGAIIWSNIKNVYYGNTAKDAENIGFRDKQIYEFLDGENKMLNLEQHNRDLTIKTFNQYQKSEHDLY